MLEKTKYAFVMDSAPERLQLYREILTKAEYKVEDCEDAVQGHHRLFRDFADLAIVHPSVPIGSVSEYLVHLALDNPQTKIFLVLPASRWEAHRHLLQQGLYDFLDADHLESSLSAALAKIHQKESEPDTITSFLELISYLTKSEEKAINTVVSVAGAQDPEILKAIEECRKNKIAQGILIGPKGKIQAQCRELEIDPAHYQIQNADSDQEASDLAVSLAVKGEAEIVMKGMVKTATILKAALNREHGLRTGRTLTHICVCEIPGWNRFLILSDGGMIIKPDLEDKIQIIQNAVMVAKALGIKRPKVALLSAADIVKPSILGGTADAVLCKMNERGQIPNCQLEGPISVDAAVSRRAAHYAHIRSNIPGEVDIMIFNSIEEGNIMIKALSYFAKAHFAGIIVGSKKPLVVVSRSDRHENRYLALCLAVLLVSSEHHRYLI